MRYAFNHYRRRAQRGFIHLLLVVLAVLGLTMWGASEINQWARESKQRVESGSNENLSAAREALFNYALVPPEKIESQTAPGRYNAYSEADPDASVPFRYFMLPCPDVALSGDEDLDGVSDILEDSCGGDETAPVTAGSRFGRLPWRDEKAVISGSFQYVRGLGSVDFRDGYNQRLWYGVSRNVAAGSEPLSPHSLLRLTDGWLTAMDENGEVLSDRVAAFVVAPGLYGEENSGERIGEESLYGGGPAVDVNSQLVEAYLGDASYAGLAGDVFTIVASDTSPHADRIEYITIDDLAADNRAGANILENAPENIYDIVNGNGEFLGVTELLAHHLQQHGFLPDPAMFDESLIGRYNRPPGPPAQTNITAVYAYDAQRVAVTVTTVSSGGGTPVTMTTTMTVVTEVTVTNVLPVQQGAKIAAADGASVTVLLRVSDLPPVYLGDGVRLGNPSPAGEGFNPPYSAALAALDTGLNYFPLKPGRVAELTAGEHYPVVGLGGANTPEMVEVTYAANPTPPISLPGDVLLAPAQDLIVVLADSAYGYFMDETLVSLISYPNNKSTADIARLPPYAAKAFFPAGTRLTLDKSSNAVLDVPADFSLPTLSFYNHETNEWTIVGGSDIPVRILAYTSPYFSVVLPPNNFPAVAGDVGLLPTEDAIVRDDLPGALVSLAADANAVSQLASEMFFTIADNVVIVPFAPPGRPAPSDIAEPLFTPYIIPGGSRFSAPRGSRVIYPAGGSFALGDEFAFPADSVMQFAAGAVLQASVLVSAVLPGGGEVGNAAAVEELQITLVHGGYVKFGAFARPDISSSEVVSAEQKLFDVELRGAAQIGTGPGAIDVAANNILRPYINRRFVPPPEIRIPSSAVFSSDSYIRAGFIKSPRRQRVPMPLFTGAQVPDALAESDSSKPQVFNNLRGLHGANQYGDLLYNGSPATVSVAFDEDTQFFIPPGKPISLTLAAYTHPRYGTAMTLMRTVDLPRNTALYDADAVPPLDALALAAGGHPVAVVMPEKTVINLVEEAEAPYTYMSGGAIMSAEVPVFMENRLALYPESDMYMHIGGTVSLVAAGSVVDLLEGVIHSPAGVARLPRVAEDLFVRSRGVSHIYFENAVTLRADRPIITVDNPSATEVVETAIGTLNARYVSYADYVDDLGATPAAEALLSVNAQIILPPNSYIAIPPGGNIPILSDEISGTAAVVALADHDHLPPGAVAVIPAQSTMMIEHIDGGTAMTEEVAGPAYLNLSDDDGNAAALINLRSHLSGAPLVFLTEDAYLYDGYVPDVAHRERLYSPIPRTARLDIFGNIEQRLDSGFFTDLMPPDSRQFFEDFPMVYAVAPECRLTNEVPGSDCAEGEDEGLSFELRQGEEYILQEEMEIPSSALITSAYPGVSLTVEVMNIGSDAIRDAHEVNAIIIGADGLVTMSGGGYVSRPNDKIIVRVNGNNLQHELRAYFTGTAAFGRDISQDSYAAVQDALTLYSGGYVGSAYGGAAGGASLVVGATLNYGYGAELLEVADGEKIFGDHSDAALVFDNGGAGYMATVNLADYVSALPGQYIGTVSLSADTADVDVFGGVYVTGTAGGELRVLSREIDINEVADTGSRVIEVAEDAAIPMQRGFLWHGYVPQYSDFTVEQNTLMVSAYTPQALDGIRSDRNGAEPAIVQPAVFPDAMIRLRIQSAVSQLNGWGSGLERPEALDFISESYLQQDSAGRPYVLYGVGRHTANDGQDADAANFLLRNMPIYKLNMRLLESSLRTDAPVGEGYGTGDYDVAVETFAGLMDGTRDAGGALALNRKRAALTMAVRVRNIRTGESAITVARWSPVVVTGGVTVTGYIRINSGSSSPLPDSGGAGAISDKFVTFWYGNARAFQPSRYHAAWLQHEWMGRYNQSSEPEDAMLDGFMCSGSPATAVFNIPHTDITGTGIRHGAWPTTGDRDSAHLNRVGGIGLLVERGNPRYQPGMLDIVGYLYNSLSAQATMRTPYAPVAYSAADNADQPRLELEIGAGNTRQTFDMDFFNHVGAGAVISITTHSDIMFYMDSAYHSQADSVYSPVPQQTLYFGDDFRIHGPAALMPPFAGQTELATRQLYAERSNLITGLFPHLPPLHPLYDKLRGQCARDQDNNLFGNPLNFRCERMYGAEWPSDLDAMLAPPPPPPYWFPYTGGAIAFEGLDVRFNGAMPGNDDVRVLLPQPSAEVRDAEGNTVTIYAGSVIYPKQNVIYSARPIPAGQYQLIPDGEVIAQVDVSPARREVNYEVRSRRAQAYDGGNFNWAPAQSSNPDCVVEPLGFTSPAPVLDLDPRAIALTAHVPVTYAHGVFQVDLDMEDSALPNRAPTVVLSDPDSPICEAAPDALGCIADETLIDGVSGNVFGVWTYDPVFFKFGVIHDRSQSNHANRANAYHWQDIVDWPVNNSGAGHLGDARGEYNTSYFPPFVKGPQTRLGRRNETYSPLRYDGTFNRGYLVNDQGRALLTAYYSGADLFTPTLNYAARSKPSTGSGGAAQPVPTRNTDARLANPAAYQWQVAGEHFIPIGAADVAPDDHIDFSYTTVGVVITTSADEFEALRLAHVINMPAAPVNINSFNVAPYAGSADNFFTFPPGSEAIVVNNDLGSWLSANPYFGLQQAGTEIDNIYIDQDSGGSFLVTTISDSLTIQADNDSYRRIDLSGRHVAPYLLSEGAQAKEPLSNVPVHTNVWLRLPEGGRLVDSVSGDVIELSNNSVVNPVLGTYLYGYQPAQAVSGGPAVNQYRSQAIIGQATRIVRPALVIPPGAKLVAGRNGGIIRNVKAALIFSLAPLESIQCPTGVFNHPDGQNGAPVTINQIREGILENNYVDLASNRRFGPAHPCAWLDDPENMDGDRLFVYRGRRRYLDNNIQIRSSVNDHTYLLGGKAELF